MRGVPADMEGEGDRDLAIEGLTLERGTRSRTRFRAVELADGSWVEIAAMVVRGAEPGPVFYLGAAFHGDEIAGTQIVGRVASGIDPAELRGTLIAVPVQNPLAFQVQHRFFVGHMLKSPMDQNPADPWAAFPGDAGGNTASILAHAIYDRMMRHADYMIDVHTPTTGGRYAPFAFLPPTRCGAVVGEAEALARAFGADYILANDKGMYVGDRNPHTVMGERGVPAFGIEIGEGGRIDGREVALGVRGIANVLRRVGMMDGPVEQSGRNLVIRTMDVIRARRAGVLTLHVGLNDEVSPDQHVATITDPFDRPIEEIVSPRGGPVVRIATHPTVSTGERVVQLGVPRQGP